MGVSSSSDSGAADLEDLEEADDIDMDTLPVDAIAGGSVPKTEIMGAPPSGMDSESESGNEEEE